MIKKDKSNMDEKYLTINDVAEILKVAYLTVYRWIKAEKIVAYKVGKQYRVKDTDFQNFVNSSKHKKNYGTKN